ncbi:Uncharacterised protein [Mycobacteroides abscessus subsp. abscessus]|nr:Uncharacterised protein [Mycobacteroides abscessus subsp. abscessus]
MTRSCPRRVGAVMPLLRPSCPTKLPRTVAYGAGASSGRSSDRRSTTAPTPSPRPIPPPDFANGRQRPSGADKPAWV